MKTSIQHLLITACALGLYILTCVVTDSPRMLMDFVPMLGGFAAVNPLTHSLAFSFCLGFIITAYLLDKKRYK